MGDLNAEDQGLVQPHDSGSVTVIHPQELIIGIGNTEDEAQENYQKAWRLHGQVDGSGK